MSIYATLWCLQFPREGSWLTGGDWAEVIAQGVPAHVGTPTVGYGYESGDPYAEFLPPALRVGPDVAEDGLRAVVFVASGSPKGTARSGQEYVAPLLVLDGAEYARTSFQELHDRISAALGRAVLRVSFVSGEPPDGPIPPVSDLLASLGSRRSWDEARISPRDEQFPAARVSWHDGHGFVVHCVENAESWGGLLASSATLSPPSVKIDLGGQVTELWPAELFVPSALAAEALEFFVHVGRQKNGLCWVRIDAFERAAVSAEGR